MSKRHPSRIAPRAIPALLLALTLVACGGSATGTREGGSTAAATASAGVPAAASTVASTDPPDASAVAVGTAVGTAIATPASTDPGGELASIDACALLTQAEVEREAGGTVTMSVPTVGDPNPRKETRCSYTAPNVQLDVRTSIGRRDYDLEFTTATAQGRKVADLPGLGDAAFTDRGQLTTSVNVLARGRWLRVFGSFDRNQDLESMQRLATAAVARLP